MAADETRGPTVIAPPPLLFAGPWLAGALLDRIAPLPALPSAARRLGLPVAAAGLGLGAWFAATMRSAGTPVDPRHAPTTIVTGGPFAHTRNPGYAGLALIYAGASLAAGRRWPLVLLPGVLAAIDRGVVRREEVYLRERFGQPYEQYLRAVPRWR